MSWWHRHDALLSAMFGPPTVNSMLMSMMSMYGDLVAMAMDGDEAAQRAIDENPIEPPTVQQDIHMLWLMGIDVTEAEVLEIREHYGRPT